MSTFFPAGDKISVEINGRPLGAAGRYRARAVREVRTVDVLGQAEAAGIAAGAPRYTVEFTRVRADAEEGSLYDLAGFSVSVGRLQSRVLYTGCEWSEITEEAEADGAVRETIKLTALGRMELWGGEA